MPATDSAPKGGAKKNKNKNTSGSQGFGRQKFIIQLKVPSGSTIGVIRPGVQGLMKAGILESLDTLTGIVQSETIPKAEGKKADAAGKGFMADPEAVAKMFTMVDKIAVHVVREPRLLPVPTQEDLDAYNAEHEDAPLEDPDDLREDRAYVDYVDEMDKMFIMQYVVGGSADLAKFRKESKTALGGILAGQADEDQTE